MADFETLLSEINSRKSRTGIITADRYFRDIEGCSGGLCPIDSLESWEKSLKESANKLTCTSDEMKVVKSSIKEMDGSEGILKFDAIITTTKRDRDGDVLDTKGAELDMNMPLLWQHIPMNPIGKMTTVLDHTKDELKATFILADTAMGRDAAALVKIGALRISHGFNPTEYEPMEDEKGWLFTKFEIFEVSLVSIPSNTDAVVTSFGGKSFETDMVKNWAKNQNPETVKPCSCKNVSVTNGTNTTWTVEATDQVFKHRITELEESLLESEEKSMSLEEQLVSLGMMTPAKKTFEDIEREYIAELSNLPSDVIRKSHRRLSLMLRSCEDEEFDNTLQSAMG